MTHHHFAIPLVLTAIVCFSLPLPLLHAQNNPQANRVPNIELTENNEEGERLLFATVTIDDEPVEGVTITFSLIRTFGNIVLGREETFDDGTAAVDFPSTIPGDSSGYFTVVATIEGDDQTKMASAKAKFKSDAPPASTQGLFPAALWSARPLWPLVIVIGVLLAGVWSTYAFVVAQLIKLHA